MATVIWCERLKEKKKMENESKVEEEKSEKRNTVNIMTE